MTVSAGKQLRHVFWVISGATPSSGNNEYWDGDILWVTPEDLSDRDSYWLDDTRRKITKDGYDASGTSMAPVHSIVLSKRAPIGQLAVLRVPACSNQGCLLLVPRSDSDSRYFYYWLTCRTKYLQALGRGSTFMELSIDDLKSVSVPDFPPSQQRIIGDYLDRETARLDALVAAKERTLEMLEEKRQALISQAVTRGIAPDVPYRDSGVPWLGDIPTHWSHCHLKRALASVDYGISDAVDTSGSVAVLRMGDIQNGEIDYSNIGFVEEVHESALLQPGDIVFNRTNSLDQIGKTALFRGRDDHRVSFASYLVRFRCGPKVLPEFLNYLLNSSYPIAWGRAEALPAIGQANLNPNRYGYLPIALPSLTEQRKIVEYISEFTGRIDALHAKTLQTVTFLKERRAALIGAAVTGQIDVERAA